MNIRARAAVPARAMSTKNRLMTALFALGVTGVMIWPAGELGADPTGSVRGMVKVARAPAAPAALRVTTAQQHCGQSVPSDELVVGRGGVLANAVVWIEGAAAPAGGRPAPVAVTLDQQRCRFAPHVSTATVGAQLALTSRDPILHNVHAFLGSRTLFNVAIPVAGMVVRKPLAEPGRVTIKCDVHAWMSAHVHVFRHPYHAVTAADGTFQIPRVPAGTYPVKVWHERLGEKSASVTVAAGAANVALTY